MTCPLLFVYGTLQRSSFHPMARFLQDRARFLAVANVPGRLYDLGDYPGLTLARDPSDRVHGELFRLHDPDTTLGELDMYEGADAESNLYQRSLVPITCEDGTSGDGQTLAWAYFYLPAVDEERWVPSGRWPVGG